MTNIFRYIFIISVTVFCVFGFYRFAYDYWPHIPSILGMWAFWLIVSFIFFTLAFGVSKGVDKANLKVPKIPAITVFSISGIMLLAAVVLNSGI